MATVFTIGHSNHRLDVFVALLRRHGVAGIADVRAFPGSRRWPHFHRDALGPALAEHQIAYDWLPELGGRRGRGAPDSPHVAWTVAAFRNYADHMESAEFAAGLARLLALAETRPTAVMCAEARWWQCHRRLISDRLTADSHQVRHILGAGPPRPHQLAEFARIAGGRLIYDGQTQLDLL